jgi:hypothetical protein
MNTTERDAQILRDYKHIGDTKRLAEQHGLSTVHVLRLIHAEQLKQQVARSNEYAQALMNSGEVVFALPANTLQTGAGAEAIIQSIQSAIRASNGDMNVLIAVAVIPVEHIHITQLPLEHPYATAATLQAKAINGARA